MSTFEVTFPDEWLLLPEDRGRAIGEERAGSRPPAAPPSPASDLSTAAPMAVQTSRIDALALPAVLHGEPGARVPASCSIAVVPAQHGDLAELCEVAEGGPHPGLERDSIAVRLRTGPAVRSAAFRFAEELLDDEGAVPYAGEIRYALTLPGRRIGVLHFETPSLDRFPELERLFDAIAHTARVA